MGISTIKPHEGMDTPEVWKGVVKLFEEISKIHDQPHYEDSKYWLLNSTQIERLSQYTRSYSEASIIAWQDAYRELSTSEVRKILHTPRDKRHLKLVQDDDS